MTTTKGITKSTVPVWMITMFVRQSTSTVVEFLNAVQILIPYFFNYTSKLQFLSMSVDLLYKILCAVFFDAAISLHATISLPVHWTVSCHPQAWLTNRTTEQENLESQDNSDSTVMATGWTIQDCQGQGILSSPKHPASYLKNKKRTRCH